ncbi:MAG: sortase [Clostridiales bacterium]|jgi:SrtB family sortase|nr:sortase [Clostridiales bacterium]
MKKYIALLLLAAFLLTVAACNKEPEDNTMNIGETSAPTSTPAQTMQAATPSSIPTATPTSTPVSTPQAAATPTPKPTPEVATNFDSTQKPVKELPKSLSAAQKINSDVYGWIKVPNTNINYPILYSSSWYYDKHDIYRNKLDAGSIYSYYNVFTRNNVITGHNMRKAGTMFHELHKLQDDKASLTTKKNRMFDIDWFGVNDWEVFALYETTDSEPKSTLEYNTQHLGDASASTVQSWIDKQRGRSEIDIGVKPSPDDFFITLVTCGDNYDYGDAQSRLYFFLRSPDPSK